MDKIEISCNLFNYILMSNNLQNNYFKNIFLIYIISQTFRKIITEKFLSAFYLEFNFSYINPYYLLHYSLSIYIYHLIY